MATINRFEDLKAWQHARHLTKAVYRVTNEASFYRDYALRNQMRKAAISISSNIAEGFERDSTKAFLHFLSIAKGSAGELRSQCYVALDEGYIDSPAFEELYEESLTTIRLISGLIKYLQSHRDEQRK